MQSNSVTRLSTLTVDDVALAKKQLKYICESKYFKSAKKMQNFLTYIVEKTLAGEGDLLKQYAIGVDALSLSEGFNPNENPSVRIMGGRVRQRLNDYYNDQNNHHELLISLPKGSYIPEFKKKSDVDKDINQQKKVTQKSSSASCPILALVSFTDKTQNKNTNRLLLQLTDAIATEFSRFMSLQLVVCNPYADKEQSHFVEKDMKSTNRAEYILNLFLQKDDLSENKYRLIYRLLLVETGEILWSENYVISDKPLQEQDYIIGKLIATVGDHRQGILHNHWSDSLLLNEQSIPALSSVLAYYRKYINYLDRRTFAKGVQVCLDEIDKNANNLVAHVTYAAYCRREYVFDYGVIEDPLKEGMKSAEITIRLGPNVHEAHVIYALLLFCLDELDHSLEEFKIARSISKNNIVTEFGYGFQLCKMSRWEEGVSLVNKAMLLSSNYPSYYHLVPFFDAYRKEKYEQALYEAKKITTLGLIYGPLVRCISYAQLEKTDEAKEELEEIIKRYPSFIEKGQRQLNRYFGPGVLANKIWADILKVVNQS